MQVICLELWIYCFLEIKCVQSFGLLLTLWKFCTYKVSRCFLTWLSFLTMDKILFGFHTCRARCQKSMNHENDESSAHHSDVRCQYQAQFDNRIFTCRVSCKAYLKYASWQTLGVLAVNFLHPIYPFNSHECQNFILQYQHRIKQTSDENKEKCHQGDY